MERKKIENMRECCKNTFHCNECPCEALCDDIEDKVSIAGTPSSWNDKDIDYILDEIN